MSKTNRELNQAYDQKQIDKVRPQQSTKYNFKDLEAVIRAWVTGSR